MIPHSEHHVQPTRSIAIRRTGRRPLPPVRRPLISSSGRKFLDGHLAAEELLYTHDKEQFEQVSNELRHTVFAVPRPVHVSDDRPKPMWIPSMYADGIAFLDDRLSASVFLEGVHRKAEEEATRQIDSVVKSRLPSTARLATIVILVVFCGVTVPVLYVTKIPGTAAAVVVGIVACLAITIEALSILGSSPVTPGRAVAVGHRVRSRSENLPRRVFLVQDEGRAEEGVREQSLALNLSYRELSTMLCVSTDLTTLEELSADTLLDLGTLDGVVRGLRGRGLVRDVVDRDDTPGISLTRKGRKLVRSLERRPMKPPVRAVPRDVASLPRSERSGLSAEEASALVQTLLDDEGRRR
ncbi:hypothetical protein AB0C38_10035 [Amycolatopsis sp. NPDC048633]|uniref:hypothetical protein n=1 Tax=Amycolatopsis sp. NPDC048633 TaxID=3157095 RepID=UPI0033D1AFC2